MQAKTFVGKFTVRVGEYENDVTTLIVANSRDAAWTVLEWGAQSYYGDETTPEEDGGYYANGGEIHTSAKSLQEIGLATFLDLKSFFMVRQQPNVTAPDETAFEAALSDLVQNLTNALNRNGKVATHTQVLHAVASAYGHKNWNLLRTKLEVLEPKSADAPQPAVAVLAAEPETVDPAHAAWVKQEFKRVGLNKIWFLEKQGYSIFENGSRRSWYATLATLDDPLGTNRYLSVHATLDDLVAELWRKVEFIPDEIALALCWVNNLKVYEHITTVWFSPDDATKESYATAGDAARAVLRQKGIKHDTHPSFYTGFLGVKRRCVAQMLYDAYDFNARVVHSNGWEDDEIDRIQRVVFLHQQGQDSLKVTFRVDFKRGSAEAVNRSVG